VYYLRHVCDTKKGFTERRNYTGNKKRSKALMEEAMYPDERKKEWTKVTEFLLKVLYRFKSQIEKIMCEVK